MTTDEAIKIFAEIDACLPLMRAKLRATHLGKSVDWTATFFSGELESNGRAFVALRHEASNKMLLASVKLDDHAWLLSCPRGEEVQVQGRIAKISALTIDLKTVRLTRVALQLTGEA